MYKKNSQKGIIPAILALIIGLVCIVILVLVLALIVYFNHIIAGLIGGGNQPGGNCNVGCGFDTNKVDYYTKGNQPDIADATSEEAKDFAVNILKVEPSQIATFDKGTVENMIRAEVAAQWSALSNEQQHGATQADAQQAILAYQEHESSAFQLFRKEGNRLVPSLTHDSSGVCTNILSITRDKWAGNKRKEIAIMWDIKYDIYLGVQENINNFVNKAHGSGQERWKNTLGITFWPGDPGRYWRQSSAETAWNKYQNEVAYNCQISSCASETGFANVPLFKQCDPRWGQNDYDCPQNQIGKTICSSGCGTTSAAMVLKFYGKNVDPAMMAKDSIAFGDRPCGQGTSTKFFSDIAQKYNLKYKSVNNFEEAMQALKAGKPVIAGTSLTSKGHYVVLTGINNEGLIMVNDPMAGGIPSATQTKIKNVWKHGHLIEP